MFSDPKEKIIFNIGYMLAIAAVMAEIKDQVCANDFVSKLS